MKRINYEYIAEIEKDIEKVENELSQAIEADEWLYLSKDLTDKRNHLDGIVSYLGCEYVGAMYTDCKLTANIPNYL